MLILYLICWQLHRSQRWPKIMVIVIRRFSSGGSNNTTEHLRRKVAGVHTHRHRTDKYLDTLIANQPISDGEATNHCQKGAPQDGRLPELIVARSCLTNHSEAASL